MLLLTDEDVERLVPVAEVVKAVEKAFKNLSLGRDITPLRTRINVKAHDGDILFMPCYVPDLGIATVKIVSVYPSNASKGLPTTHAAVVVADPETGVVKLVTEARALTGLRTGAATAVAAKYLARRDSRVIGLVGCGYQAKWQLLALTTVLSPAKILVTDIILERADQFSKDISPHLGCEVLVAASAESVVRSSDVVVTATTSKEPVVKDEWVAQGTHISAIGAFTPDANELEPKLVARAKVVVDSRQAALSEAGDIIKPIQMGLMTADHIHAELGEVALGHKPGRVNESEVTVFKSVGLAVQDAAAARVLLDHLRVK